jgi:hypothetical protein
MAAVLLQHKGEISIEALIAANRVADARALLRAVPANELTDDLRVWAAVLAEPTLESRAEARPDGQADLDWLRQHSTEYAGQWVALRDGVLIVAAESLREVLATVDRAEARNTVLIHKL